jgi:hypothetical protein
MDLLRACDGGSLHPMPDPVHQVYIIYIYTSAAAIADVLLLMLLPCPSCYSSECLECCHLLFNCACVLERKLG